MNLFDGLLGEDLYEPQGLFPQYAMDWSRRGRPEFGGADIERAAGMGMSGRGGGLKVERTYKDGNREGWEAYSDPSAPSIARFSVVRNGKDVRIENIYAGSRNPAHYEGPEREAILREQQNILGPRVLREILRQFREQNPDIKSLSGERISGARRGGRYELGTGMEINVPLSRGILGD